MRQHLARLPPARAEKRYRLGTHRVCAPEETLRLVDPHLRRCGITRVADVTGLDRIGIPVFMAIRPNARSLAVSQGKGLDSASARASAVMEAVELHHAEHVARPLLMQSFAELRTRRTVADPSQLSLVSDSLFSAHWPIPWIEGIDLVTDRSVWVPYELVHADTTVPPVPGSGCFERGTNGLASGNTPAEAVLHGLCEVVERDACALWEHRSPADQAATRIDLGTVDAPAVTGLIERFSVTGVPVEVWDVTGDIGIPAFRAMIFDEASDPLLYPMGAALGAGCHPDRDVALCRALTEAAQSRLTAIAGSRDDLARADYGADQVEKAMAYHRLVRADGAGRADARSIPSLSTDTIDGDVEVVLDRLGTAGLRQAIVVDLSDPEGDVPISVVRVIVPGLEGPTDAAQYRPGPRARALAHG
jgi:ribosomal protein S12 methylthiotransferase accessory factor